MLRRLNKNLNFDYNKGQEFSPGIKGGGDRVEILRKEDYC